MKILKVIKIGAKIYAGIGIAIDLLIATDVVRDFEGCRQYNIENEVTLSQIAFTALIIPIIWPVFIKCAIERICSKTTK